MRTLLILTLLALTPLWAYSDEPEEATAQAPPNHTLFRRSFGGAYFIPNALSEQYEELTSRVDKLRESLDTDDSDTANALREVEQLTKSLDELRAKIEKAEKFVSPVKIFEQTDTYEFDLAQEPRVVIVADQIRLSSWDGPGIRCVLKKSIIAKEKPAAAEFEKVFVEHELKVPKQQVGETAAERKVRIDTYYATEAGKAATEKQRAMGMSFEKKWQDSQLKFIDYQGKLAHVLKVRGLDTGERTWTSINIRSEGGSGTFGGQWDRRAELTVQMPRKVSCAVFGCQVGVSVDQYEGSLLLTNEGSTEREYGQFMITGVKGDLAAYDVRLQSISQIEGSVTLVGSSPMRDSSTSHSNNTRTMRPDLSGKLSIREVEGGLTVRHLHLHLEVADIAGPINIENRYGSTQIDFHEIIPTAGANRIVSESGLVRLRMPQTVLDLMPWTFYTQVGEVQVNVERETLEDVHFFSDRQTWNGMITSRKQDDPGAYMTAIERPQAALDNEERSPGFDVISRAGRIVLQVEK